MKVSAGQIVAITGAGSGIGRALTLNFARRGCHLAAADINAEHLAETAAMVKAEGVNCSTHVVDVADREAVEKFAADVVSEHGGVNMIINNAGVTLIDSVDKLLYSDFDWIMNINFWGVVYGSKAFLPYLRQADAAHIVNVSSLFGLMSLPLQSAYNSSKFAVRGFTEALKMELAGSTIGVSCVHPGGIKTSIVTNSRIGEEALNVSKEQMLSDFDKAAITTAEQTAEAIIRGVEQNKRRILVGRDAKIMDWVVRHFPGSYEKVLGLEKEVRRLFKERDASRQ
jgi:short-subunit dehydrogenase